MQPQDAPSGSRLLPIDTCRGGNRQERDDHLALEEPLDIQVQPFQGDPHPIAVTLRTPGHDTDLALGFLLAEGVIRKADDVRHAGRPTAEDAQNQDNRILVQLAEGVPFATEHLSRHVFTHAGCGMCGKVALDYASAAVDRPPAGNQIRTAEALAQMADAMRRHQPLFDLTGGVHGAAVFDAQDRLVVLREDIGRHNALDKAVGSLLAQNAVPLDNTVLLLSGRIGFELVQKALCAGIPTIAAVGAPTSLAVDLANRFGMTLVGFLKQGRMNIYCGAQRIR